MVFMFGKIGSVVSRWWRDITGVKGWAAKSPNMSPLMSICIWIAVQRKIILLVIDCVKGKYTKRSHHNKNHDLTHSAEQKLDEGVTITMLISKYPVKAHT